VSEQGDGKKIDVVIKKAGKRRKKRILTIRRSLHLGRRRMEARICSEI